MELPIRAPSDRFVAPGRYGCLQASVRRQLRGRRVPVLFIYAFDHRTRLGPFLFLDRQLIPGAPQAVGAALHAAGLGPLRIVLQQWTPRVRPSCARFDGQPPELLLVSSMAIHSAAARALIQDAWQLGPHRPLILAGGPKAIYEPWDFFVPTAAGEAEPDCAVTGEEFVLLQLLERLIALQGPRETLREAFERARREGLLEEIPGLVYRAATSSDCLVNTAIQRLVQDLDELPMPLEALGLYEPPHNRERLSSHPVPVDRLRRYAQVLPMVTTHGCKFRCSYCPIPAYNQLTFRAKSPERIADELAGSVEQTRISTFFSTDDNFFNHRAPLEAMFPVLARRTAGGRPFRDSVQWATEATEFDVYKNRDLIPAARDAGLRLIWFGIEDLTAELIRKGQSPQRTEEVFRILLEHGIGPMPMLMHHDGQPLWSRGSLYGLLNQVQFLKRQGALSVQVTFLTPAVGTKGYEEPYRQGMVLKEVAGEQVDDLRFDGNHCIATADSRPWRKQLNLLAAYALFYNPARLLSALVRPGRLWWYRVFWQVLGNLTLLRTSVRQWRWIVQLARGPVVRHDVPPRAPCKIRLPASNQSALAHYGWGEAPVEDNSKSVP